MGRRKIEIVRVKNSAARQVTFSKRRTGLFKKANEISILCGIEIAIVVVSPGNKCYSFGNPSVDGIASKFLQNAFNPNDVFEQSSYNIDDLNQQLDDLRVKMDEAEKESKIHDEILNKYKDVQLTQLKELKDSFVEFNDMVKSRICDFDIAESMMLLAKEPVIGIKYHVAEKKEK